MIYDHPRESRLPKWAQQLLNELRIENSSLKYQVQALSVGVEETNVVELHPVHQDRPLTPDAAIQFDLAEMGSGEMRQKVLVFPVRGEDGTAVLRIESDFPVAVIPSSSTSLQLGVGK